MFSEWYAGLIFVLCAIAVGALGVWLARRHVDPERLKKHNEVAGPIHATLGVIYAVLLAFVVITVWEQYADAERSVAVEADAVSALFRDAGALEPSDKAALQSALTGYVNEVLSNEWNRMETGTLDGYRNPEYDGLWNAAAKIKLADERDRVLFQIIVDRLNKLDNARSVRQIASEFHVPSIMWILLIAGGIVTIVFACYFGADDQFLHAMMVSGLSAVVAFILFMIAAIAPPFVGMVSVDQAPFEHVLSRMVHN